MSIVHRLCVDIAQEITTKQSFRYIVPIRTIFQMIHIKSLTSVFPQEIEADNTTTTTPAPEFKIQDFYRLVGINYRGLNRLFLSEFQLALKVRKNTRILSTKSYEIPSQNTPSWHKRSSCGIESQQRRSQMRSEKRFSKDHQGVKCEHKGVKCVPIFSPAQLPSL